MIDLLLQLFIYLIIADALLSWFPEMKQQPWVRKMHEVVNIPQKPIRDMLPKDLPLDPTPMIMIIICQFLMYLF